MNILVILAATLVPLIVGFVWYSPKIGFGKAWMQATGITMDDGKNTNMVLVFGLTILFSFFVAMAMHMLVIHQIHIVSLLTHQPDSKDPNSESMTLLKRIMELFGTSYRTFKHGAFHGTLAGIMLAVPIIGVPALFERRSFKYVAINAGYWIVCMALMGGIICQFAKVSMP